MDKLKEFLEKHNIVILDTNKRWARRGPIRHSYFTDEEDFNKITSYASDFETERLVTLSIPESDLYRIQSFEEQVFNNMKQHGAQHYMMFNVMMEQKEKEKYLRNRYTAVKKAYEHYSLMLKLAEHGEIEDA